MSDRGSNCCCAVPPNWYDLLLASGAGYFPIGVVVDGSDVMAYGFTDTSDNSVGSELALGRFGTPGDLDSEFLRDADARNSCADDAYKFDLHDELVDLCSHTDAAELTSVYYPTVWPYPPVADGKVAWVDGLIDLDGAATFATVSTVDESDEVFGVLLGSSITKVCWLNNTGAVTASHDLLSVAEMNAWGLNSDRTDAPLAFALGSDTSLLSWSDNTVCLYEYANPILAGTGEAVALLTAAGHEIERVVLDSTGVETDPGGDAVEIPGVRVEGYVVEATPSTTTTRRQYGCDGIESGDPSEVAATSTIDASVTSLVSADTGEEMPETTFIYALEPEFCSVFAHADWHPRAIVDDRQIESLLVDTSDGWGGYAGGFTPIAFQGAAISRVDTYGFGRRVGPSVIAELDTPLWSRVVEPVSTSLLYPERHLRAAVLTPWSWRGQVEATYTINEVSATLEDWNAGLGDDLIKYAATDKTSVALYDEVLDSISMDVGTPDWFVPPCPLGTDDGDDGYDPETGGRVLTCVYSIDLVREDNGRQLACVAHGMSDTLTKTPIYGDATDWHIEPFFNSSGEPQELPSISLATNSEGRKRGVLDFGTTAVPGEEIYYLGLRAEDVAVFWDAPLDATHARFVLNCRWSNDGDGTEEHRGSDLVFMSDAETIVAVCRVRGTVDLLNISSQAVYIEQSLPAPGPDVSTGYLFWRDGTAARETQYGKRVFDSVPRNDWDVPSLHPTFEYTPDPELADEPWPFTARLVRFADTDGLTEISRTRLTKPASQWLSSAPV